MVKSRIAVTLMLASSPGVPAVVSAGPAQSPHRASVVVEGSAAAVPYDPMVFGGFIEHLGKQIYGGFFEPGSRLADEAGFRLDVIEAVRELKVPVVRWPGGCFVDSYHWRKGVGEEREPYDDDRWGVREPNTFGTHEFIELCRRLGAEPYICQNSLADIQEMADWVGYCNDTEGPLAEERARNGHPAPFDVHFWSVGNEKGGRDYIDKVRDTAVAMKRVDPTIQVTCSGSHGPRAYIDPYLFETAGEHLDLLSVHEYWVPNYQQHQTPDYLTCMLLTEKPDAHVGAVVSAIEAAGMGGRLSIAFDEWNLRSWHHPGFSGHHPRQVDPADPEVIALLKARDKSLEPSLYTMADALFCASFFNACLRHPGEVSMANIACLVNQTGPLFVHPEGVVRRAHFHAMAMYANQLGARVAGVTIESDRMAHAGASVAMVDAIATVDASGQTWSVVLMNRHPTEAVKCSLHLGDLPVDGTFEATLLDGDSPDAFNDIEHPDRVAPRTTALTFVAGAVQLPPHSLGLVKIPLKRPR